MNIGFLGQGRLGQALAGILHQDGNNVKAWSRTNRQALWPVASLKDFQAADLSSLDSLILASGSSSPKNASVQDEQGRTLRLLQEAKQEFPKKVFYLSSGAVYGDCISGRSEKDNCLPITNYGIAKLTTELALRELLGEALVVLRIGNIVPNNLDFGIFKMIAHNVRRKHSIVFQGAPSDCRDYILESELNQILARIVTSNLDLELVNLGTGVSLSLGDISEILKANFGEKLNTRWEARSEFDVPRTILDVKRLNALDLRPSTLPETAVKNAIEAIRFGTDLSHQ
jgi:nucleoside-diphosphate-sugar epimerase